MLVPHQKPVAGHNDIAAVPAAVTHSAVSGNANVNARAVSLHPVPTAAA